MKYFFLFIALVAGLCAGAQQIELDAKGYGEKKFKLSEKKVHIDRKSTRLNSSHT